MPLLSENREQRRCFPPLQLSFGATIANAPHTEVLTRRVTEAAAITHVTAKATQGRDITKSTAPGDVSSHGMPEKPSG